MAAVAPPVAKCLVQSDLLLLIAVWYEGPRYKRSQRSDCLRSHQRSLALWPRSYHRPEPCGRARTRHDQVWHDAGERRASVTPSLCGGLAAAFGQTGLLPLIAIMLGRRGSRCAYGVRRREAVFETFPKLIVRCSIRFRRFFRVRRVLIEWRWICRS